MKQYLLPASGTFYKANLHSHSTLSDGLLTPEQMRDAYKAHGYDILAITDHELMFDHTDLSEENFLIINGYEVYMRERQGDPRFAKNCHMNFLAKDPKETRMICVDPQYQKYAPKNGLAPEDLPRIGDMCSRIYGPRCINCMIKKANEAGYLVAYNHPNWSLESIEDLSKYHGMYAMEIYNHGVAVEGFPGDDSRIYDQLLFQGHEIYCVANDDNHNKRDLDDPLSDSFGGFTMIKADKLEYQSVINALEKGHFYASQGPKIEELYIENGILKVKSSAARSIFLVTMGRVNTKGLKRQFAAAKGESLYEAEMPLVRDDHYFRVEVVDHEGRKAWSHAYFMHNLDTSEMME